MGGEWRRTHLSAQDFADLPGSHADLLRQMTATLDRITSSRAAGEGWIDGTTLRDAHTAVWQALLRLIAASRLHVLLRESAGIAELADVGQVRRGELATLLTSVGQVAGQLAEVGRRTSELEAVLAAAEADRERERRVLELGARLTGDTPVVAQGQPMPAHWQDTLDTIGANVEGALTVLAVDARTRGTDDSTR